MSSVAAPITNIAAYKFAPLADLKPLRERLLGLTKAWKLKGTILLSPEGINLFVAGPAERIDDLLTELRAIPGLEDLTPKISVSDRQPFTRMLVRIKKEIIAFGVEGIDPVGRPAPKITPQQLKQWLDSGRPVTLLDTRNDYEVKLGTFAGATTLGIDHFREFPQAVVKLPAEMKQTPIVMFCTGGIRCEKAGPFMQREGFEQIYQLEGGILKYFEECGSAHYDGECFVFDQRVGLDPSLQETRSDQCFACYASLTADELQDSRYVKGVSCPNCFIAPDERRERTLQERQAALLAAATPLPGSTPYDNDRPLNVPLVADGRTLLDMLAELFVHVPRERWAELCAAGRLLDADGRPVAADRVVRAGQRYLHRHPNTVEPEVATDVRLLHEDEALVVLEKPAPLPMHPSGRFHRNTLQYFVQRAYEPERPRPAHRLDANTSGVVVLSRTRHFASLVQPQFARGEVEKVYLARVQGAPAADEFECTLPISDEAGDLGSRTVDEASGQAAHTRFRVLRRFADGTTLLEVCPLTGRTNQIRVHLWQLGLPICGEQTYLPGRQLGTAQTHAVNDPPLCLHSWRVTLTHPRSRERVSFSASTPKWAELP